MNKKRLRVSAYCAIFLALFTFQIAEGGESLTCWGYVHIADTHADTSNGLYLRNYIVIRSTEIQYLHGNQSIYFIDINDSTKAWICDAGNFPTPESMGDPDIAVIDWENEPGTVDHKGFYAVINDTIWDPAVHAVQQFSNCRLSIIPLPDTTTTAGQIELIWNSAQEDPGVPDTTNIIGYNVYRGNNGVDFPLRVNPSLVTDTFFTDNSAAIGDSVYFYAIKLIYRGVPDGIESMNFSANSPMIRANDDIAILSIDAPFDSIEADSLQSVITIKNTGRMTAVNFFVLVQIDSLAANIYSESVLVTTLSPDSLRSVSFPYWYPGAYGCLYEVTARNLYQPDANPFNDTLSKIVVTYLHDVGMDTIYCPGDTIEPLVPIDPAAVVQNYGNSMEGFHAYCRIDSLGQTIYLDSVFVDSLKSDSLETASFSSWTPFSVGSVYEFSFWVVLPPDVNHSNDTLKITPYVAGILETEGKKDGESIARLLDIVPNPCSVNTVIRYLIPDREEGTWISLRVYDTAGRDIKTLYKGYQKQGHFSICWDGKDNAGKRVSEGIYFLRFNVDDYKTCKKIILIR